MAAFVRRSETPCIGEQVEPPFAGEHEVGGGDPLVEADRLGHQVEAALDRRARGDDEAAAKATRSAAALHCPEIDAQLTARDLCEAQAS